MNRPPKVLTATAGPNSRRLRLALSCVALPLLVTLFAHALAYADPIYITPEVILIGVILWKGFSFDHIVEDASQSTIKTLIALAVSNLGMGLSYVLVVVLTRQPHEQQSSSIYYPLIVCVAAAFVNLVLLSREPRVRWALVPSLGSLLIPIGGLVAVLIGYQRIPCLVFLLPKVLWPFVAWPMFVNVIIQLMVIWPLLRLQAFNRAFVTLAIACGLLAAFTILSLHAEVLRRSCG